ncbi:DNA internalization-related competence protein ComEC/Rec2 [Gilliamella sp. Pra-s65]|uniref:DNA internalization-related competence protein ComEC/Rec2 n=1 Tax=unclassified Gilliamella TaxID=2685620 RepID=UPI001365DDDF|nr:MULTISPECIES: DNA internalization-related competence protein ComEC/Rec2 [unclassified Gilliamella]MWN89475.1 DNA internalization-related competence protein ComEC/Rec2 [Gilliamella sp. Pra-s65]MWP72483.1 DNA internalization-related competence protein ComEC/Rec2 [Gilliamella sp. Pra-s52]
MRQSYSLDLLATMFSLSCLPLLFLPHLLSDLQWYFIAIILLVLVLFVLVKFCWYLSIIIVFGLGFLWSIAYSKQYLTNISPYIDKTLVVKAKVVDINTRQKTTAISPYYLSFSIFSISGFTLSNNIPISVYWDNPIAPKSGQTWQLTLKTKVMHSYLNEGGFDSQRFSIANRSLLSAKLVDAKLLDDKSNLKQLIVDLALPYIDLFDYRDILLALTFGDRSQLDESHRMVMMQTGIAHLMAISGMHILVVFGLSRLLVKIVLFFIPKRFIHFFVPIVIGWLSAFFYAWLTGFNPPTLRAILALSIWIYLCYKKNQISAWQKVNRIIALLLLFDPLMILSESFWLSCYAVISLIFLFEWLPIPQEIKYKKRWYMVRLLHLQLGLTMLLLPIQCFVFQGVSGVSILTNLIAIPIISLCTFPAVLFALIFSLMDCFYIALWCWSIADKSLEWLFFSLNWFNFLWLKIPANFYLLSFVGWLTVIIIRTGSWRRFSVTLAVIFMLLITPIFKQPHYRWRLDMLDVGHGLAIVIHDGKSAILYDTGAKWEKSSAVERIIIPFLQWHNLNVQGIIISHQHNDHVGGLDMLQYVYPKAWLMSSSSSFNNDYQCLAGNHFIWNELTFSVLWPNKLVDYAQNEDSCVVQISDGRFSVLLTGDLERNQEYQLVTKYQNQLTSTILQAPHHGSNTSSSYPFLNHVKPVKLLVSTSRYNPWKLPSSKVIRKYQDLQLDSYVTAKTGQISLFFDKQTWQLKTMRGEIKPRWYHDWFGSFPIYE